MTYRDDAWDPDEGWDDEWNAEDWYELDAVDRGVRNTQSWRDWAVMLFTAAIVVPLVLGLLAWILILLL